MNIADAMRHPFDRGDADPDAVVIRCATCGKGAAHELHEADRA